ncbi:MAG TPA: ABC-type transport auxiliary lipoprotein family protein [Kofleriaceae bacterium]
MTRIAMLVLVIAACGGSAPQTRYYQLAPPVAKAPEPATSSTEIAVEPLVADGAYGDQRMIYRSDPVRLDFYDYHRWSTAPGAMIAGFVEKALAESGQFSAVTREATATTAVVLGGRVTALEEVDVDPHHWVAHVAVELAARDASTGKLVWTRTFDEREPESAQTPEGLARAAGVALGRIVRSAAPDLARLADRAKVARQLE